MRLTLRPTAMLALGALTVGSIGLVSAAAIPAAADEGDGVCAPLATEVASAGFEDGTDGWNSRGGATAEVSTEEARTGAQSLSVSDRTLNWHGTELPVGDLFTEGTYQVSAWVMLHDGVDADNLKLTVQGNDGEADTYTEVAPETEVTDASWVNLCGTYSLVDGNTPSVLYVEANETETSFYLDDVYISTDGPAPVVPALSTSFEDGLDGWAPRHAGEHDTVAVTLTDDANEGDQSALISDRTAHGSGMGIDAADLLVPGTEYQVSAWVKFVSGETPGDVALSLEQVIGGNTDYANLIMASGMSNTEWVELAGTFTVGNSSEPVLLYFETHYDQGNTSSFMVDDIEITAVPQSPVQDLTPLQDTLDMPVGVAIDTRELTGGPAELMLRHFNQITAENHMKVEEWYDEEGNFRRHAQATEMLDFAVANDLGVFGHVLVWHEQTPDWFFENDQGEPLTNSESDKQTLRDRLEEHIFNVAKSIYDDYGPYGSAENPIVAWDVVNEVVADGETADGLRQSPLYQVLGEEYIHLAFELADEAFNDEFAAEGADRPVLLYINDYNTEQEPKASQYEDLVRRMDTADTPLDGVGHQFHLPVTTSIDSMRATMDRYAGLGLHQAVTEFDVTINPANEANRVLQGHFYRDAFAMFRDYHENAPDDEKLSSITIWGLTDNRSWRSEQQPLMFNGNLQAKPAYYGAVGDADNLPDLITTANVFAGDLPLTEGFVDAIEWRNLPMNPLTSGVGGFQTRWSDDHMTVLVRSTVDADRIEFTYDGEELVFDVDSSDSVAGVSATANGQYLTVAQLPHSGVSVGDNAEFDLRVVVDEQVEGAWNSPGAMGELTFFEELSTIEAPQLDAPTIDGEVDSVWSEVPVVTTETTVEGASDGAKADARSFWQGDNLYVLFEVTDPVIDATNSNPWEQDGVELFLDLGNRKAGPYGPNDTQIRVTVEGDVSFGTGNEGLQASRVLDHAVVLTDDGYNVELAIALIGESGGQSDVPLGGEGSFHGIDFQVNDGRDGSRYAVHTWAEPTGTGYQTTARWGVMQQVDQLSDEESPGDPGDDNGEPGDGDTPGDGEPGDGGETPPGDGDEGEGPGDGPGADVITPLPEDELHNQDKGGIEVPDAARAGGTITIHVGTEHSGVATQTFLYSEPQLIGQSIVDADGNIRVTIPADTPPGTHTIAVYDADGNLLGWDTIEILAADGSLPVTGAEGFILPLSIGLLLMLLGVGLVVRRQFAENRD